MRKLVVRQVEVNNGQHISYVPSVVLQHFGIHIKRWSFPGSIHNVPKIHKYQQHFNFELPKVGISLLNLSSTLVNSLPDDGITL